MRRFLFTRVPPIAAVILSGCGPSAPDGENGQTGTQGAVAEKVDIAPRPAETGTAIPFPDKAEYLLLSATKEEGGKIQAVVRRYSQISGYTYTKREYDCGSDSFTTLAEGDTLQAMAADTRPPSPGTLFYGSSAHQAAIVACRKFGIEMTSVKP